MALTERTEEDRIEIVGEFRQIQVRTATIIERDGVEVSRTYTRETLDPHMDVTGKSAFVKDLAKTSWTQTVKDAWATHRKNSENFPKGGPLSTSNTA